MMIVREMPFELEEWGMGVQRGLPNLGLLGPTAPARWQFYTRNATYDESQTHLLPSLRLQKISSRNQEDPRRTLARNGFETTMAILMRNPYKSLEINSHTSMKLRWQR